MDTTFLSQSPVWQRGFLTGMAYTLMAQQCPLISGIYAAEEEEQLFLFSSQMGYTTEWKHMGKGKTKITFQLIDDGN